MDHGNTRERFTLGARFTYHRDVVFTFEKFPNTAAHDLVVIDKVHVQHDGRPIRNV
jgi:hypothetical protein